MTARHPVPEAALEHHIAVLGKTGSGKSYAAQGIVERLIAKRQRVCVIDPTDRYWGLRLLDDGKKPSGHDVVIFGGQHADLPLAATHGAALAEIVGTTATPAIIATRLMTVGERTRFFTDFAETLLRKNEGPLHLIIDEAHLFAPQTKVASVESGKLLHATNNLVSLGRGIGLRIMLLSQRPAKLHKDSLTQVETLVAMRLIAPQDRAAIKEWVREWADEATGAEMMASLPSLPTGAAWLWAPELDVLRKVEFPRIQTYDSGRPLGSRKAPTLPPIDLAKVSGKLEVVAKEAVENDPKKLKAEIAQLRRQMADAAKLAAKDGQRPDPQAIEAAEQRGFEKAKKQLAAASERETQKAIADLLGSVSDALAPLMALMKEQAQRARQKPDLASQVTFTPSPPPAVRREAGNGAARGPGHAPAPKPSRAPAGDSKLSKAERLVLTALAQYPDGRTKNQVALLSGYAVGGGGFGNALSALRSKGFIVGSDRLTITSEGAAALGPFDPLPHGQALLEYWYGQLGRAERSALEVLARAYPAAMTKEECAAEAGYEPNGGGWNNALSRLRTLELISGRGELRISEDLFS